MPLVKPAAPTNLRESDGTAVDKIDVSWESNEQNIVEFELQRKLKGSSDALWASVAKTPAGDRKYPNGNLCVESVYEYRIRVNKANNNNSDWSNIDEGSTSAAISSLNAIAKSSTQIDLNWDMMPANVLSLKYNKTSDPAAVTTLPLQNTDKNKSIPGLVANTEYSFRLEVVTTACSLSRFKITTAKTLQEATKLNLVATPISDTQINLVWKDNEQKEEFFAWEISTDNNTWKSDGLPKDAQSLEVKNLLPNTKYYFRVRCTVQQPSIYYSDYSNTAEATTKPAPVIITIPIAPTSLTTAASGSDKIVLNWTDNASNESGFDIERTSGAILKNWRNKHRHQNLHRWWTDCQYKLLLPSQSQKLGRAFGLFKQILC
jgi:hypothetical protein